MQLKKWGYTSISCLVLAALIFLPSCDEDEPGPDVPAVTRDTTATLVLQGQTAVFCLGDEIFDLENVVSSSVCYNSGIGAVVSATEACVTITNDVDEFAPDTLCVVHCNELTCDTTVIIVVACPECFNDPHECFPYGPTELSDSKPYKWEVPNQEDFIFLTTPGDPGGGYWMLEVSTDAPGNPRISIDPDPDAPGAIITTSGETDNLHKVKGQFQAYPDMSYSVRMESFLEPPAYPWPFNVSYTFFSRVDCYEPNNTLSTAKYIPRDETITAYAVAGHIDYFVASNAEHTNDWYKFRLEQDRKIRVRLTSSPSDIRMYIKLFNAAGEQLVTPETITSGGVTDNGTLFWIETPSEVPTGTYYIQVYQHNAERKVVNDEPVPDHWDTPYTLMVTTP